MPGSEFHLGFTGADHALTPRQNLKLRAWVGSYARNCRANGITVVGHHGDCVGGDAEFHAILLSDGGVVEIHPPDDPKKRAFCQGARAVYPEKPYLKRDDDVARASEVVLACPAEDREVVRSGTWATVRAAVRRGKDVVIITPDGTVRSYEEVRR